LHSTPTPGKYHAEQSSVFFAKSSGYVWRDQFEKRRSRPHDVHGNPLPYRRGRAVDLARYGAAGGFMTTPADYAKFMMGISNPKPQDKFHLSGYSLKQMMTPQITVVKVGDDIVSWGLGWRIARTKTGVYWGHGGENPGFQCISEACTDDQSGLVIMTNGDNGTQLLEKLAPEISRRLHS
jgi:CubicO group peptidase (beta-lactamase class C family)